MGTPLKQLEEHGQSVWIDYLSRSMLRDGELEQLVRDGVQGVTSNPTIFQSAIAEGDAYDEQLREVLKAETDPKEVFLALAKDDIRDACTLLRPVFDRGEKTRDGWVSLEVDPNLEVTEFADRSVKNGGPALLFEKPKGSNVPLLINSFASMLYFILQLFVHQVGRLIRIRLDPLHRLCRGTKICLDGVWILGNKFLSGIDHMSWIISGQIFLTHQFNKALFSRDICIGQA